MLTCQTAPVRIEVHVRPGASRAAVGGTHGGALVVRVTERAEHGRATAAALEALADAVGVPRRFVKLVRGTPNRRKVVEVAVDSEATLERRLQILRGGEG